MNNGLNMQPIMKMFAATLVATLKVMFYVSSLAFMLIWKFTAHLFKVAEGTAQYIIFGRRW